MSQFIKTISADWVRAIIAIIFAIALVVGFFMGIVTFEFFKDITLMVLTYFFVKRSDDNAMKKEIQCVVKEKVKEIETK